ncbi:hypothetical protein LCGC14_0672840 [marine sediment metagenome]|uniref:Uncharacterized protein n=1 Tax=marine sediment metagenome TaxID=412755 RepID=A0A0F9QVJ1_9ZZZZ
MMTKQEIDEVERKMCVHYGRNDEDATDFAFSALVRLLAEVRRLRVDLAKNTVRAA